MDTRFWMWVIFGMLVPILLAVDLLVLYKRFPTMTLWQALRIVTFWIGAGLIFGGLVFALLGKIKGLEYLTAYIVEYSLSMDNIFVFIVIFSYFAVPREAHHFCLYLGILGAIFFRGVFIFGGIELVEQVVWAFLLLGGVLLYAAIRLLLHREEEVQPEQIWLVHLSRRFLKFSSIYQGTAFFVRKNGKLLATPIFLVILAIEGTDIIFALDSVPAVLGITHDRLIAYTSNLFAILGLRALYFVLASLLIQLYYLRHGLAVVLGFIAIKLMLKPFHIEIPILVALGVVVGVLAGSILASLLKKHLAPTSQKDAHKKGD